MTYEDSILCNSKKQVKCQRVDYKLCEKDSRTVPVIVKQAMYIPVFGKEKIMKTDRKGRCISFCTDFKDWKKCHESEHIVDGVLCEKIYAPHFSKKDKSCTEEETYNDESSDTESDTKSHKKHKKNC